MEDAINQAEKAQKTAAISNRELASWFGTAATAGAIGFAVSPTPAKADAVSDVNAMVTSLGTIAATVTTVVVGAMTVRLAIKFVNRMTVKG